MIAKEIVGRGWAFPLRMGNDGSLMTLTDTYTEIEQSIRIILLTPTGNRVMRPEFGCRIHELIFDPNDGQTAVRAEQYVREALRRWEPRIELLEVKAISAHQATANYAELKREAREALKAQLVIHITYQVKHHDDPRSLVFPFYLIPQE